MHAKNPGFCLKVLGDVGDFIAGSGFPERYQGHRSGEYPFAKVGDISRCARAGQSELLVAENWVSGEVAKTLKAKVVPVGGVLFAKIGEGIRQNFRVQAARPLLIDNNAMAFIADPELLDARYAYHFLCSIDMYVLASATTVPSIRKSTLEAVQIPLPALPEQRRIAAILDKADALRAKRREAIAKLDQLLQSVFLEMFGDPVKNVHEYPLVSLADTVEQNRPITYGILMPGPDIADGVPYVRVVDIRDGKVITASVRRTSFEIAHAYRRSALIEGDLLMSIRGHVGRVGITPRELEGANITQDTARISVNKNFDSRYIFGLLSTVAIQRHMTLFTRGAAVKGINLKDVREIPVPVPPKAQQLRYGEIIQKVNDLKNTFTHQLEAADRMFFSLQSDAFNVGV